MIRVFGFGHAGLAMSTSVVALFGFLVLFAILRKRIHGVHGRELAAGIGKVLIASAAMGIACALSSHLMEKSLGVSQLARLADLAVSIPISLAVFYGMCRALGVTELDLAIRAFTSPIRRRFSSSRS
jgi:putative peptidoglycan lipid II flippase